MEINFYKHKNLGKKGDDPEAVKGILYAATQIAAALGQLGEPFIPFASEKMLAMMNVEKMSWDDLESTDEFVKAWTSIRTI